MTLNLLFITVTFKKRETSYEEVLHNDVVSKHFDDLKIKQQTQMTTIY